MVVGAVSNAALAAVVPVLVGQAFNAMLKTPPQTSALMRIALLILISQVVRAILQFGRNFGAELLGQRVERDIRHELYVSLLGKSMTFHSLQPVGDTMARATNDVREVNFLFSPGLNLVIGSGFFLLMPLFVAPRYHPSLILVPLLFIIGYFLALWQYLHELSPITTDVRQAFGRLNSRLAEAIDGIETVKGMAQEEAARWSVLARTPAATGMPSCARATWKRVSSRCCCWRWPRPAALLHALLLSARGCWMWARWWPISA